MVRTTIFCIIFFVVQVAQSAQLLIPMDESQKNHLKSYGLAFWLLKQNQEVQWLLNYQGGSFMFNYSAAAEKECKVRGITYETITDGAANAIITEIQNPSANMNVVKLLNAPKIAVYSPKTKQPWDDAVTLVLTYAEIPYDIVFDDEVLGGKLLEYDWLHLHHEDFTGQFGKFYSSYHSAPWYVAEVEEAEAMAKKHGFGSARELKRAVVFKIRDFMLGGGFLFAMCSATDTYDI
ncbi:MAG: asparagine synthetase B, partial [Bacteroidota bacterium]